MHRLVLVTILVLAAAILTAATSQQQLEHAVASDRYEWAELADSISSSPDETEFNFHDELHQLMAEQEFSSFIEGGSQISEAQQAEALQLLQLSSALSAEATPTEFFRFAHAHNRQYASSELAASAYAAYKANKRAAAEMNAEIGATTEDQAVFAATGPHATMTPQQFKRTRLTAKNPRGRGRGRKVKLNSHPFKKGGKNDKKNQKNQKNNKISKVKKASVDKKTNKRVAATKEKLLSNRARKSRALEPGVQPHERSKKSLPGYGGGHRAGMTGGGAGKSGKVGGKSGKVGGKVASTSGKSGKIGGVDGGASGKSGKIGGGGVVNSSSNDGIALPGNEDVPADERDYVRGGGYTDPKLLVKYGFNKDSLFKFSNANGIGATTYADAVKTLQTYKKVGRALQYNDRGELLRIIPVQLNDCGSCYVIAAQQSLQRYWTAASFPGVLSIQQALDCIRTTDSKGCAGGTPMEVLEYWATNLGAVEKDYPTKMMDGKCLPPPFPSSHKAYPSAGWDMLIPPCTAADGDKNCMSQIRFELMVLGFTRQTGFKPPIAYVDATNWQSYRGGVFPPSKCESTLEAGNHVVQIIGSGIDNMGIPYWTLDNFWGDDWGEGGTIRVPFGINACGLFNFVIYAKNPPFATTPNAYELAPKFGSTPTNYVAAPVALGKVDQSWNAVVTKTSSMLSSTIPTTSINFFPTKTNPGGVNSLFSPPVVSKGEAQFNINTQTSSASVTGSSYSYTGK